MTRRLVKIALVFFLCIVFLSSIALNASAASTGQIRLGYPGGDDWEPAIAADHYGHVYVLWMHFPCSKCAPLAFLQVSGDRGQTWSTPRAMTPNPGSGQFDTQIVVDPMDGKTVYASWLQNNKSDTVVTKSTDFGQTWSTPVVADSTNAGTDKPILAVRGRDVYVGFDHQQKVWVAASHDGGVTFSVALIRQNSTFGVSLASGAVIDSHRNVYFGWAGYTQSGNAKGPVNLYVSKSTDGGSTWANKLLDTSASPPDCSAFSCGWAYLGAQIALGIDANDTIYALWNAGAVDAGPERIYFARSNDGGATWSPRQDVSLAPSGVNHAFPALVSRSAGDVRIGWMDARSTGQWNVYYRTSSNSGNTWSGETKLSSFVSGYSYLNANGFAFPYGDYWEMDMDDLGQTQAIWGEGPNWNGPGNIWYARVTK